MQEGEQLDQYLGASLKYIFLTLSVNLPGWVGLRHSEVLKSPDSQSAMPGRCVLQPWRLSSSQLFPVKSGKSNWPGKWPNSLLLMTPLQQKRCVGRQAVSSWGGRRHASPFV